MTNSLLPSTLSKLMKERRYSIWVNRLTELVREVTKNRKLNMHKHLSRNLNRFQRQIIHHCFPAGLSFWNTTLSWKWNVGCHTDYNFMVCGACPRRCKSPHSGEAGEDMRKNKFRYMSMHYLYHCVSKPAACSECVKSSVSQSIFNKALISKILSCLRNLNY